MRNTGRSPTTLAPWIAIDALLGWLGAWQIVALVSVFVGLSFDTLTGLGLLAFVGLALPLVTRPWDVPTEPPPEETPVRPDARLVGVLIAVVIAAAALCRYGVLSVGSSALMVAPLALLYAAPRRWPRHDPDLSAGPLDLVSLVVVGAAAALLTTWLCRPDVDDAYYLNEVIQTLKQSDRAVLSFDGVHGVHDAPLQQIAHRPQTYELWVAFLTRLTGVPPRTMYWLVVPGVVAALSPLAWWSLARLLSPRSAWLAIVVTFGALVVWGDGTQTIGRFGFVRLYQGKSVFVTAMVPLVAHAAWRYTSAPSARSWLRLLLAGLAATTFTSTAMVVVPITAGLALLGGARPSRQGLLALLAGFATSAPMVLALGLSWLEVHEAGGLASDGFRQRDTTSLGAYRSGVVLASLATLPWLLQGRATATWVARTVGVADLLLLSGLIAGVLGETVANLLNWRVFWAVPYGALLGVAGAEALSAGWQALRERRTAPPMRLAVGVGFGIAFVANGAFAIENDEVTWRFGAEKVNPVYERVADGVARIAAPHDVVAAASHVSQALAMREERPALVGVWERYLLNLTRFWGKEESKRREDLLIYTRGSGGPKAPIAELDAQCVRILVRAPKNADKGNSRVALPKAGFRIVEKVVGYEIWERPVERLPAGCLREQRSPADRGEHQGRPPWKAPKDPSAPG